MANALFDAVMAEKAPMYDAAVITEDGIEFWKNPVCNNANNSHSVTKFFIATAIGQLCDADKLSLDDKVTSFFTAEEMGDTLDEGWHNVSVRHALQHKTGMEHIPYGVDEDEDIEKIGDDFLKYVFSLKIEHTPGVHRHYSDEAYYLLGRIINKASGMDTVAYIREHLTKPLDFRQWAMVLCPQGYPICGGGFFARADDVAKLGYAYACGGMFKGKRIVSEKWIETAIAQDFACTRHRDSDVYVKTGARGQMIAFSIKRKSAAAWHGCADVDDKGKRNDRLLDGFLKYLDAKENR